MGCTSHLFAVDLRQCSFIDRLRGFTRVEAQGFVDHSLITAARTVSKIPNSSKISV